MKTKLTLSVDRTAVSRIKSLARRRGVSVSALFEDWTFQQTQAVARAPLSEQLQGRWKAAGFEKGDARLEYLLGKHGGR